ncbi:hypothetical protein EON81_23780 [bacterium]|nr:MAG: hypothetical protein EON81_23780 [bacterium]
MVAHLVLAVLFWIAAGWLRRRTCYTALLVLEILTLLVIPHGTILGVFGLIILMKPHVRAEFKA